MTDQDPPPLARKPPSPQSAGNRLLERLAPAAWVVLAMLAAVVYGIVNDQVTVALSPEYFSVFKRQQFWDLLEVAGLGDAPTRVQAMLIGAAATWWFGLMLGMMVSLAGSLGRSPRLSTRVFVKVVALVMVITAATSLAFGVVGYLKAPVWLNDAQWLDQYGAFLHGIEDTRSAVTVGCWHDGAYLGGFLGTVLACLLVPWWRRAAKRSLPRPPS